MWSRLPAPCRKRAVWLVNEDVEAQLELIGTASPSTIGLYVPQGVGGNEFSLLKGRPVVAEQCPVLGTPGDICLGRFESIRDCRWGTSVDVELDVGFLTYQGVFRFVLRVDGRCVWQSPITPFNGSQTRSPYICLAQR
jgi:HK97 family phage major capsid protein